MARDESYASEAANLRIAGATRLHCEDRRFLRDDETSDIVERDGARGKVNESQSARFNAELRRGSGG